MSPHEHSGSHAHSHGGTSEAPTALLERYMWLSIATAVVTVGVKAAAAWVSQSAGLLSDALETTVNLVAAIVGLWALRVAAKPADEDHEFGHGKAEYFSSAVEGALIFIAAGGIIGSAVLKLLNPQPLEELGLGLALSMGASLANLVVGLMLVRAGRAHRSITLEADGRHLLTDVLTSIGVAVAMAIIWVARVAFGANWEILDPIIAIAVGLNIIWTGYSLMRRSVVGLLDAVLPAEDVEAINSALGRLAENEPMTITQLRTRASGRQRFVEAVVEVPGDWTVLRAHTLTDALEDEIARVLPGTEAVIHVEPIGHATRPRG